MMSVNMVECCALSLLNTLDHYLTIMATTKTLEEAIAKRAEARRQVSLAEKSLVAIRARMTASDETACSPQLVDEESSAEKKLSTKKKELKGWGKDVDLHLEVDDDVDDVAGSSGGSSAFRCNIAAPMCGSIDEVEDFLDELKSFLSL